MCHQGPVGGAWTAGGGQAAEGAPVHVRAEAGQAALPVLLSWLLLLVARVQPHCSGRGAFPDSLATVLCWVVSCVSI